MIDSSAEVVLRLLQKALNPTSLPDLSEGIDWDRVLALASGQCVGGVCMEAIELLPVGSIPKAPLLQWIGQTEMQKGQYQYAWEVARKLDRIWAAEGIEVTVLKGRALAQYYPVPHHRYSCDLDLFIGDGWGHTCDVLERRGIQLGREVYKEVEFMMDGVYVECHRYITPLRGNKHLKPFELYLRSLLKDGPESRFDGTTLVCPPLMFSVLLFVEHALGDFLHGKLLLKHVVDWVILRRQAVDWEVFNAKCKEFNFDKFLPLIDAFADVVEGKLDYNDLRPSFQKELDGLFQLSVTKSPRSWFGKRVELFFDILRNGKKYRNYGYTSMPSFLFNSVWTHFFDKEVRLD